MSGTGRAMRTAQAAFAALLVCGALLPAALAAQDPQPQRRVRNFRFDSTRDSSMLRVVINADQIERMIHELMASKAMEQNLVQSMREAATGQGDSRKMRELSDQLGRLAQKNAQLSTTIEMTCAGDRQPDGYIGVQFDLLQTVSGDDVPASGQLQDYPKIDMVYPDSPASKAGIRRGDIVLSLGGQDTRRPVVLDRILKPMTRLPVRIQRDGSLKDITVTIEKRPADYNSECANVERVIGPEFDAPVIVMRAGPRGAAPSTIFMRSRAAAPDAPDAPAAPRSPMAAMAPVAGGFMYGFSGAGAGIAGAMLLTLDDDWRAALGVDNGVLVSRVLPGTPAKDSGLRGGDVIISADGEAVASVRTFSRIVSNSKTARCCCAY